MNIIQTTLREFFKFLHTHRKKFIILIVSFALGLMLLGSVFSYVDIKQIPKIIMSFNVWKFLLYLLLPLCAFSIGTFRWSTILKAYGFKVKFLTLLRYLLTGFGFSYLTPANEAGGAPLRAYMLKNQKIPFDKGLVTVLVDDFMIIFMELVLAGIGVIFFIIHIGGLSHKLSWLMGLVALFFIGLLVAAYVRLMKGKPIFSPLLNLFGVKRFKKIQETQKKIVEFESSFISFFNEKKKALEKIFIITLFDNFVSVVETGVLLHLLGLFNGWGNVFLIRMIINVTGLLPVPARLGVTDWSSAGFFATTDSGKAAGVVFSLIFRAKNLVFAFLGVGFFCYEWIRNLRITQKLTDFVKEKMSV